ncbi:MAG: GAF domain-containing protein [Leptospira sp.]|nr:GAF domain-containing protein [Leptospira sp.]NCS93147.1 GAF domain-containing protein [Leptospira sp.]
MRLILRIILIIFALLEVDTIVARPIILTEDDEKISVSANVLILEDPDGKLDIQDVTGETIGQHFKLNQKKDLNLGLTHSVFWLKFDVENKNISPNKFVLACEYRLIDHFDVYLKENDQWRMYPGGDQQPRNNWRERQRTPYVTLKIPANSIQTILIRANSEGSVQLPVSIFTQDAFVAEDRKEMIWGALVFGIFAFIILYSLLYGIASRSDTQIAYSIFLTGLGLFVITQSGIGQILLWGPASAITNRILVLAGGIALIGTQLFFVRHLSMDFTQPRFKYAMYGSSILGSLLIFTAIFLPYYIGAILLIPCAIYNASVVLLTNIYGALKKQREAIIGLVAWSVACFGFIIVTLQYAGFLPRNFFIENANILGVLFGITLQSLAIADRVLFLQRQEIETTEKHNLELEQRIEERTLEVRQSRNEIEQLADFARRINETFEIELVLDELFEYFETEYGLESVVVSIVDEENNELRTLRARYLNEKEDPRVEIFRELRVPLTPEGGVLYRTFQRQRPFYFQRRSDQDLYPTELDQTIVSKLGLQAFAQIPLVIQKQTVGIMWVNFGSRLPSLNIRRSLERFCQQIAGALHSAILLDRVALARNEIEKLAEVARRATEDADTDAVLKSIFEFLEQTYGVDAVLFLADSERQFLRAAKVSDGADAEELEFLKKLELPLSEKGGVVAKTFLENRIDIYNSPENFSSDVDKLLATALNVSNYAQIPLRVKGDVIGVLSVTGRDRSMKFSEVLARKIERFCTQIAGAVQTATLLKQTDEALSAAEKARSESEQGRILLERINQLSRSVMEEQSVDDIVDTIYEYVNKAFGIDCLFLFLLDDTGNTIYIQKYIDVEGYLEPKDQAWLKSLKIPMDIAGGVHYQIVRKGRTIYFPKVRRINTIESVDNLLIEKVRFDSALYVPIKIKNQVIGVMDFIRRKSSLRLNQTEISELESLVTQVAGAVHSSQLLSKVKEEKAAAEKARSESEILAELARRANEGQDLDRIQSVVFDVTSNLIGVDGMSLWMYDPKHETLVVRSVIHHGEHVGPNIFPEDLQEVPLRKESGTMYRTFTRQKPLVIPQVDSKFSLSETDRMFHERIRFEWTVQVPLVHEGRSIGLLNFAGYEKTRITRADRDFMERVSYQVTGAVQAADLLQATELARAESDRLLTNILPRETANELKAEGKVKPQSYDNVSVLFTDFVGFTRFSESLSADRLVQELDRCFSQFDEIVRRQNLEKLKTIGDAYMCAGGLPRTNRTHAVDTCLAALEILSFCMQTTALKASQDEKFWKIRIGIHSGPVTAGVIGSSKFAYDIWGDTVNTASRMESHGLADRINLSTETYEMVKDFFLCEPRGSIHVKGKGELEMYFLDRIRPELSLDRDGLRPNGAFEKLRAELEPV